MWLGKGSFPGAGPTSSELALAKGVCTRGTQPITQGTLLSYQQLIEDGVEGTGVETAIGTVGKVKVGRVGVGIAGGGQE